MEHCENCGNEGYVDHHGICEDCRDDFDAIVFNEDTDLFEIS